MMINYQKLLKYTKKKNYTCNEVKAYSKTACGFNFDFGKFLNQKTCQNKGHFSILLKTLQKKFH